MKYQPVFANKGGFTCILELSKDKLCSQSSVKAYTICKFQYLNISEYAQATYNNRTTCG